MPGFARLGDDAVHAVVDYVYSGIDRTAKTVAASSGASKFVSDGYNRFLDADGYPAIQPPWGTLTAINMDTGKFAWKLPLGEYPELAAKGMTNTGSENYGGPIVTAGGLLFIAATISTKSSAHSIKTLANFYGKQLCRRPATQHRRPTKSMAANMW